MWPARKWIEGAELLESNPGLREQFFCAMYLNTPPPPTRTYYFYSCIPKLTHNYVLQYIYSIHIQLGIRSYTSLWRRGRENNEFIMLLIFMHEYYTWAGRQGPWCLDYAATCLYPEVAFINVSAKKGSFFLFFFSESSKNFLTFHKTTPSFYITEL